MNNLILACDSYKQSHWLQYPPGTTNVFSYFEARNGAKFPFTTFFGLQYLIKKHLLTPIRKEDVGAAKAFVDAHMGPGIFNYDGWIHIVNHHGGKLPVRIRAIPEGTNVPISNALMTVEATDPHCFWLPSFLETLLVRVWYPTTVATVSNYVRGIILDGLRRSGNPDLVNFKLHDFGYRGVSSEESAAIGGAAHLVNFDGSDTIAGIMMAMEYYNAPMCGFSIPASEHSTITSWGRNNELLAMKNMLTKFPKGLVACVSDSYDINHACDVIWGNALAEDIMERDGVLVVRPDSGDIVPTTLSVLNKLYHSRLGGYVNRQGFKVLNEKVRIIQGDGCSPDTIKDVITNMIAAKWSVDNVAFGMGGGLLQKVDRDTQRFAYKCSSVTIDGEDRDVYKDPIGDKGKKSKKGRLALINTLNGYKTVTEHEAGSSNLLGVVYENGKLIKDQSFDEIRKRARELV